MPLSSDLPRRGSGSGSSFLSLLKRSSSWKKDKKEKEEGIDNGTSTPTSEYDLRGRGELEGRRGGKEGRCCEVEVVHPFQREGQKLGGLWDLLARARAVREELTIELYDSRS